MRTILAALVLSALGAEAGQALEVWTRRAGGHVGFSRGRDALSDLSQQPQEERALFDGQVGGKRTFTRDRTAAAQGGRRGP